MMKKLIYLSLIAMTILTINSACYANLSKQNFVKEDGLKAFYTHLAKRINYAKEAREANQQGNSIILFSIIDGKLKDLKVATPLGKECDSEVLNNILSFTNFSSLKSGKYALQTTFKLVGSTSTPINDDTKLPLNYTALKLTITACQPNTTNKVGAITIKTNEPLIILDGKSITTGIKSISPETIESINVLKDLDSISIYGEEGKNGVLIITSKTSNYIKGASIKNEIYKTSISVRSNKEPINVNDALVVLDDEVIQTGLTNISPETIHSVTVLKGLSATSLYGDEGKNGVLIITTKKENGKKEPTQKPKE